MIGVKIKQGTRGMATATLKFTATRARYWNSRVSQEDVEAMPLRWSPLRRNRGQGKLSLAAADRAGRALVLTDRQLACQAGQLSVGAMIECVPSRIFGNSVVLSKDDSYIRVADAMRPFQR